MPSFKVIEDESNYLVFTPEQFEAAVERARSYLEGQRWKVKDCIERLNGYRRSDFVNYVLIPKRDELERIGALLQWHDADHRDCLFKATTMSKWLDDNLDQITKGGWR